MNSREEPSIKSILTLPDDLVLNCLARISRFYYPTVSLVSKKFRSLLNSTELYQTRCLLGRTESCLYVCLRLTTNLLRWFIICQRPNSSRKFLFPISSPHNSTSMSSVVVVGHNIYVIGGGSQRSASSTVMVRDYRSHTWHEAPSMQVARVLPSVCTLDGKIYVTGSCDDIDSNNWMEIFDTKTQTWEFLQIPSEEICKGSKYQSISYQGTIYVRSEEKNVTYKLHKGRSVGMTSKKEYGDCCLEGLPNLPQCEYQLLLLADHGGKLAIMWEGMSPKNERTIWCAEIALEKCQNSEIWETIEWFNNMLTIPVGVGTKVHALTSTVW